MDTLSNIKKNLEFNKGLTSLIEVLKNISVSQFRVLENRLKKYESLPSVVDDFFGLIDMQKVDHPFLKAQNESQIVVIVTSDSGLLGGLNMQVVNAGISELEKIPGKIVVIGERGKRYAQDSKIPFVSFGGIKDQERAFQAMQLKDYLIRRMLDEKIGYLKIAYPDPMSFTVQRPAVFSFLPYIVKDKTKDYVKKNIVSDIILESDAGDIVEYLVNIWIEEKLYEIFGLSRLAEFAARFVHLEESAEKLKDIDNKMRLQYFRIGHEIIDRNMRELFSARLLYAGR